MTIRSKRSKILWVGVVFAVVATVLVPGVWYSVLNAVIGVDATLEVDDFMFPLLDPLGTVFFFLNFGGLILAGHIQDLYQPQDETSFAGWTMLIAPVFVGSLVQGLAYGWLVFGSRGIWATRRSRAVFYVVSVGVLVVCAYWGGVLNFHKVNCSGADGGGDCDLGFIDGALWGSVSLGVSAAVVVLIEVLIRRRSRAVG